MKRFKGMGASIALLLPVVLLCSCSFDLKQSLSFLNQSQPAETADTAATTSINSSSNVNAKPAKSPKLVQTSPLLDGLPADEIARIQADAKRIFVPLWPTISTRSRFVRARLMVVLNRLNAPTALQLVPVVESAYNPYALSRAGAVGLWQLMPGTARVLGVRHRAGFDGRRHVEVSTDAAVRYLLNLHDEFGNWPLAFAAYHIGPFALAHRIAKHPWSLKDGINNMPVPEVTRTYVRDILGLAALTKMGTLKFPKPYVTHPLNVKAPVDLTKLAHTAGIKVDELFLMNPGLDHCQYLHGQITIQLTESELAKLGDNWSPKGPRSIRIAVRPGDTLWGLAHVHHISVRSIRQLNPHLQHTLHIGELIWVPANQLARGRPLPNPLLARGRRIHYRVRSGDSLWTIASRFGTSPHAIARINQMSTDSIIRPGDHLWILAHIHPS